MMSGKVWYSDFAVTGAILVCLNLSKNYHTGIYYYFTCFVCAYLDRENNYYHKSYAELQRVYLSSVWY